jgi:hypothetical protein
MNIEGALEKCVVPFKAAVLENVSLLFQKTAMLANDWTTVPRLSNPYELACAVGASNTGFEATLGTSFNGNAAAAIIGVSEEDGMYLDALGELANNIYAVLMTKQEVVELFGILRQATPVFITEGSMVYFPKVKGICGTVQCESHSIWAGFAIRASMP